MANHATENRNLDDFAQLNLEIAELEKEVGHATFPLCRASYVFEKLGVDEKYADDKNLREALVGWLCVLSSIKHLKDSGSPAWTRMCNWD